MSHLLHSSCSIITFFVELSFREIVVEQKQMFKLHRVIKSFPIQAPKIIISKLKKIYSMQGSSVNLNYLEVYT